MTDETPPEDRRLSKFSNVGRSALPVRPSIEDGAPLADLLEHVIRDGAFNASTGRQAEAERPGQASSKLIDELKAAQDRNWEDNAPEARADPVSPATPEEVSETIGLPSPYIAPDRQDRRPSFYVVQSAYRKIAALVGGAEAARVRKTLGIGGAALARGSKTVTQKSARLARRMRPRDWRRRYLALLSVVHRHILDRKIERLLFGKTPPLKVYSSTGTGAQAEKTFVYQDPIPRKVLNWALSAAPQDLKRYAFVDFRAGNGRTLLLASRYNFEYAAGYAFDASSCEILEMNLAQYPRSYMSCRDVRALRGDRDGIVIPPQPAVLFFPCGLSNSHLDIILNNVAASCKLTPRPIYLIFDDAGRERGLDAMANFERVPLPRVSRMKTALFSPAKIAVYRSLETGSSE